MTLLARPAVALGFGSFFLCAATCAHFDELVTTPSSLVPDWTAGLVLVAGAAISQRNWGSGRQYQIAAWAFMVSLLFGSLFGNFFDWVAESPDATGATGLVSLSQGPYLAIIGVLFALALGGLAATLGSTDDTTPD
jgi:hypothetical protein